MRIVTATAVALTLAAGAAPAATAQQPSTDGTWRMDGYGTVLSIRNGTLQEYQTTAVSCLKGDSARRTGPGTYTTPDGTVLTVRTRGGGDLGSIRADGSVGDRNLRRMKELPDACTRPAPTGPLAVFDVFWQSFEENYPFFSAKGVDWHAVRDQYRPRVHTKTTKDELFALFSEMVRPLHDSHVAVQDGDRVFAQVRPGTVPPTEELDTKVKEFVLERDLKGARNLSDFANGRITYADLPGGQGYLRISGFGGYAGQGAPYAAQLAELDRALGTVLSQERVQRLKGLIVDLRINGGGSDALGIHIAERLTDIPYVAYSKRARNDPADPTRHTRPQPVHVTPAQSPRYTGPVAVLTGGSTVSAGETFAQALMDRPGRTVRIGQPTQGVFSDVMQRKLPNGMSAWLPNEEFLTRSGRTFDGTGIPPHLTEPVFTKEEFDKKKDSAFDRALHVLRNDGAAN
ncbi:protease [Streptomyces sp. WAC05374]|uniref:S41 family peptidase n=1 Tax=Streptomyces sp. WAC05374 TaxID=2487420 RepID=UPI000F86F8F5|nr:S41 family peptidase [Streptomyces sp. WAC05374]RST12467.1 protease [Streptomyces sp. WAC05374]TDF47221.1 protease [Streptomyces sp. WAC05374]TDF57479.1 protease [Streptomyces sp. WAC05374]TDF61584.1 protease [Streptomyces sp. WAC05374]